jgi:hypothetical protein
MATINDVVLIYLEDSPVSFARVESVLPDPKNGWYQIKLLMLQIPLQVVTWILKEEYINGGEFNMNGKKMKLETVECPVEQLPTPLTDNKENKTTPSPEKRKEGSNAQIISFSDLKNNKKKNEPEPG